MGKECTKGHSTMERQFQRNEDNRQSGNMVQRAESSREILSSPTKTTEDILTVSTTNTPENFIGGKLHNFFYTWKSITSDPWILNTISAYQLEVTERPWQAFVPKSIKFSSQETELINLEIQNVLDKSIIETVPSKDEDEFYSNIFIRPKKDGSVRVILNLKKFNEFTEKIHFKMETLKSAIASMQRGDYF